MAEEGVILTDSAVKELRELVLERRRTRPPVKVQPRRRYEEPATTLRFLAKLTAHTTITTGARWLYTFAQVDPTVTFSGDDATGVSFATLSGGITGVAFNLLEWGNASEPGAATPWYLNDVDAHGDDYPAGFALMPIGAGGTSQTHKIDRVVEITRKYDATAEKYWYHFSAQNQHDGTCE